MTEEREKSLIPQEIGFDPQKIAEVLKSRAERPREKIIKETEEVSVELTEENIWEIFLYNELTKIEQYLELDSDHRSVLLHTRVRVETEDISTDFGLGICRISNIDRVLGFPDLGRVWFESQLARLEVYQDCHFSLVTPRYD